MGWGGSVADATAAAAEVDADEAAGGADATAVLPGRGGVTAGAAEVARPAWAPTPLEIPVDPEAVGTDPLSDILESAQPANVTAAIATVAPKRRLYPAIRDPLQLRLPDQSLISRCGHCKANLAGPFRVKRRGRQSPPAADMA